MKIGFTCGTMDLFHAGHVTMLKEARKQCDYLIVGIQFDPSIDRPEKNKPVQSIVERQIQVQSCKYVDEIIVYNSEADLEDLLRTLPINVRILGSEYEHKEFTGRGICEKLGIQLYYNKREHSFSSSDLRSRVYNSEYAKRNKNDKVRTDR
jgi:glycerol-3-phosphate cytidylyltransferase